MSRWNGAISGLGALEGTPGGLKLGKAVPCGSVAVGGLGALEGSPRATWASDGWRRSRGGLESGEWCLAGPGQSAGGGSRAGWSVGQKKCGAR